MIDILWHIRYSEYVNFVTLKYDIKVHNLRFCVSLKIYLRLDQMTTPVENLKMNGAIFDLSLLKPAYLC